MKKLLALTLCLAMIFSVSCSSSTKSQKDSTSLITTGDSKEPVSNDTNETGYLKLALNTRKGEVSGDKINAPWFNVASPMREFVLRALLQLDENLEPVYYDLATAYTISDDGLTYTLTLRDNVKWHDGKPFSADDVVFSIKAGAKSTSIYGFFSSAINTIEGVKAYKDGTAKEISGISVSGNKVTFKLTKPFGNFLVFLGDFCIYPNHILKDEDPALLHQSTFWDNPVGTGPYKLTEIVLGNYAVFERNEDFYGELPKIKKIVMTWYEDEPNVAAVMNGQVDWWYSQNMTDVKTITKNNPNIKVYEVNTYFVRAIATNLNGSADGKYNEHVRNPAVRKALNEGIDKKTLCDQLYTGQGKPMATVTPVMEGLDPKIKLPEYDPNRTKKDLEAAGFDFNSTIRLAYYYTDQLGIDTAEFIANCWRQAGVKVETILWQGEVLSNLNDLRNYEFCYAGFAGLFPNDFFANYHFSEAAASNKRYDEEALQYMRENYDELIKQLNATSDAKKKQEIGYQLQNINLGHIIDIPLYSLSTFYMVNEEAVDIKGPFGNPQTNYNRYLENWSLK